jgi:hypothetical protein
MAIIERPTPPVAGVHRRSSPPTPRWASSAPGRTPRAGVVASRRPQEARHHVRRHRHDVLRDRRHRGAAHPGPAGRARRHDPVGRRYNQMFTMHATTMVFLFVMPMAAAFANYMMPLQIGARDVAFPRSTPSASGASCSAASSSTRRGSSAAPPTAAGSCTPPTRRPFSPTNGIDFWVLGLLITGIASQDRCHQPDRHRPQHAGARHDAHAMPIFTWMPSWCSSCCCSPSRSSRWRCSC